MKVIENVGQVLTTECQVFSELRISYFVLRISKIGLKNNS